MNLVANCKRCGKPLKSDKNIDVGYGPVCKRKQAEADAEFERIQITLDEVVVVEMMS